MEVKSLVRRATKALVALAVPIVCLAPITYYRNGGTAALRQVTWLVVIFGLAVWLGHVWMRVTLNIDFAPLDFDARLLRGVAFAMLFSSFGLIQIVLGSNAGLIIGSLQAPVIGGLFTSTTNPSRPAIWRVGFWRRRPQWFYWLMISIFALVTIASVPVMHHWALLAVPATVLGNGLGEWIGRSVRKWILALREVWEIALRMGPPIGGFLLGYVLVASIFAGLFAAVWRSDPKALSGLSNTPQFLDFLYYSIITITTTGYGDVMPRSHPARVLASLEALFGLVWTVVVFAAVLLVVQRHMSEDRSQIDESRNGKLLKTDRTL